MSPEGGASRRRGALLLLLLVAAGVGLATSRLVGGATAIEELARDANVEALARRRTALQADPRHDQDGLQRLVDPTPGEWLFDHPELGQTWEEFTASATVTRRPGRERIVLQPLGALRPPSQEALEAVRAHCALFFGLETTIAAPIELPPAAFVPARQQHDATVILDALEPRHPPDAMIYAAVCDQDLCISALENYLFGLGRPGKGLGVYSFWRFHHPGIDPALHRSRAMKLLSHEIGHGLGLLHCVAYRCVMNGAAALPEVDGEPMEPCPQCLRKLQRACGFDVKARWEALAPFLEAQGLPAEAARVRARLARLTATGASAPWKE